MHDWLTRLSRLSYIFQALRHRNYRLYIVGQVVSQIGLWMTRMATQWLVYRLTGSAWMLGVVGFAQFAPAFCVSPLAGALADRWNRHHMLVVTQLASMIVSLSLAALALGGVIEIWHVLLLCAAEGAVHGFDTSARAALVAELVEDRAHLPNAIAVNSSVFNSARMIGPALGGVTVAWAGEGLCFLIDGVSYLAVVAALLAIRLAPRPPRRETKHVLREIQEGLTHTLRFGPYRALLMTAGLVLFTGAAPQIALMPEFTEQVLGGDAATLGFLMGVSGLGALTGALYLATRRSVRGLGRVIAGCAVLFGVMLIMLAGTRMVWTAAGAMAISGFALITLLAGSNTVMQTLVDDDMRGRVMAMFVMTFMGATPLGQLLAGATAELIGTPWTLAIGGVTCVAVGLDLARQLPVLRVAARPIYVKKRIILDSTEMIADS